MTNIMQDGADWLVSRLQDEAGRVVNVVQGATTLSDIVGIPSNQTYKVIHDSGFSTQFHCIDWEFKATDLALEIRPGARLTEANGEVYEALPIDDDRPCFERLDNAGVIVVVHTKRVE